MRFTSATVMAVVAAAAATSSSSLSATTGVAAFTPSKTAAFGVSRTNSMVATKLHQSTTTTETETTAERAKRKKDERLRIFKSDQFHRKGFKEVREGVEQTMGEQYESSVVEELKQSNYVIQKDGVKVYLAKVCMCSVYSCRV